ncbi:MAG: hypothetical protein PHF60_05340 [Candidatus ainarchaeum sp.]|nr:hypothetical protein [Candidatus ainarchaeum sp.]
MRSSTKTKSDTRRAAEMGYQSALTTFLVTVCRREKLTFAAFGAKYGPLLEHIGVTINNDGGTLSSQLQIKRPKGMTDKDMETVASALGGSKKSAGWLEAAEDEPARKKRHLDDVDSDEWNGICMDS